MERNTRSEFQQLTKQLFLQLRSRFLEYSKDKLFSLKDRNDPNLKLTQESVIIYIRDYLREFRPLSDLLINDMDNYVFRVKKVAEVPQEKDPKSPRSPKQEAKTEFEKNNVDEVNEKAKEEINLNLEIKEDDDDSQLNSPEDIKKRYLFRCMCLQLYCSGLQISKNLHKFFDPDKKGYCSMGQCIFTLLNYYKIVMLPSDLRIILADYIIEDNKLDVTDDLFEYDDSQYYKVTREEGAMAAEDATIKVDYNEFLQEVTRPYVYEVAKNEIFIKYQDFMKLTFKCLTDTLNICRESLVTIYRKDTNEREINCFENFVSFINNLLGETYQISSTDCCKVFVSTMGAVESKFHSSQGEYFEPSITPSYTPMHVKPVKEITEGEGDEKSENRENAKSDNLSKNENGQVSWGSLVKASGEYLRELSKGNERARAEEFGNQCEVVFLTEFGFKYVLNHKLLQKKNRFNEILMFVQRESGGENVIKVKRKRSPKRKNKSM